MRRATEKREEEGLWGVRRKGGGPLFVCSFIEQREAGRTESTSVSSRDPEVPAEKKRARRGAVAVGSWW